MILQLLTFLFFCIFFQRLQRRSDEEEDAMKSINENSSSSENQNPNSNNSNSNSNSANNSNSMGGVIAGESWVIDSMQSPTLNNDKIIEKEVVKQEEEKEGEGEEEGDYVVDIYMQSDVTEGEDSNVPKNPEAGSHIPVVQVEG